MQDNKDNNARLGQLLFTLLCAVFLAFVSPLAQAQAPKAQAPTAQAPKAQAPKAQAPTAQTPKAQAPTAQAPTAQAPKAQAPKAQAPKAQAKFPEWAVGINGGVTFSSASFMPRVPLQYTQGLTGGIVLRYIGEKYFGWQLEANFAQRGWKELYEKQPHQFQRTLSYVEIPFLTHLYFGNQIVRFNINLGPRIGIFLGDTYRSNFDINNPPVFDIANKVTEQHTLAISNTIDYGIVGGVGIELRTRRHSSFLLEGRYYFGLGDFFANRKKDFFSTSSNQNISFALSYLFRFK